jgi:cytochrome c-type biogenesis protein CcmH
MNIRNLWLIPFFAALLVTGLASASHAAAVLADLENALMCECDDKCGKVLINCNCSTSDKHRMDLKKHIESGLTKDQIVKIYVDKYGEKVLSAPTKTGFNITAWVMPFAALLGGGIGIRKILRVWVRKSRDDADGSGQGGETVADSAAANKYSKRLQTELDKIDSE